MFISKLFGKIDTLAKLNFVLCQYKLIRVETYSNILKLFLGWISFDVIDASYSINPVSGAAVPKEVSYVSQRNWRWNGRR